ncbi:MAG: hypothetical protein A2X59_05540 [Nitrospirae bacterium GWC2_42_7]|nr:MAG: hypothetical protein A2X59_05540 [Nitrospirae bacterium GWC2_42_7]
MDENKELLKVVFRFINGEIKKGYLKEFSPFLKQAVLSEDGTGGIMNVNIDELKAIFFVKSFEGDKEHREKKTYGATSPKGHRVFIRFKDGEQMVGFLEGDVPWDHGFFLKKKADAATGFFLLPVDMFSNNTKVFIVSSSVNDVTVVP